MMPGLGAGLFILIRWLFFAIAVGLISACVLYFLFQRIRDRSNAGKAEVESAGRPVTESFINRRRKTMLLIAVLIIGAQYFLAARDRMGASACEQEKSRDHQYIGEICLLPYKDGTLFRLYDANTKAILAKKEYYDLAPKVFFDRDRVYYSMDASREDAYVLLPPSLLDRIMAKLP
ncbi:hypothetical protein LMG6871_02684 [Ralstonia edaphis]|uniref:hypothetical protein n=1 Tax=Ralstonia edaphi TaxID=3058599 RepID=UPI0028F5C8E1|nr:hypothetical protein [Ralstonia sp. LMG 6871]CAJ0719086.1 hypothetical protein LMG6871_02684 [Ralstonia sp. LMG 6871]